MPFGDDLVIRVRPRLRPVQATHVRHNGQDLFVVSDPTRLSEVQLTVSPEVFMVATLLDGTRDVEEVRREAASRYRLGVEAAEVRKILDAFEKARFVEGNAFDEWKAGLVGAFRRAPVREPVMAGSSYPEKPDELRAFLDGFFTEKGGPGMPRPSKMAGADGVPLKALIAPHIDVRRGGVAFAHAWKAFAERPRPELVVILGVAHAGAGETVTLTRKDFSTPLGVVKTDVEAVERLGRDVGREAFADEYVHRAEHSVEIQLVWLQRVAELAGEEPPRVVPALLGPLARPGAEEPELPADPREDERVAKTISALASLLRERGGRAALVASVDLAHVGRKFGDEHPLTPRLLRMNRERDRKMLSFVAAGNADGFYAFVRREGDRRKICGLASIYVTLAACEEAMGARPRARLLHYAQAAEAPTQSFVSFAALEVTGPGGKTGTTEDTESTEDGRVLT